MRTQLPSGTPAEVNGEVGDRGLVIMADIFGLRPLFDSMVARLAAEWSSRVCAVELYPGREDLDLQQRFDAASGMDDEAILADMVAAAALVGGRRVGAIGFCMGGMYVLKAVSTGRFDRLVPFYPMIRVPQDWRGPGQGEPLDRLSGGDPGTVMAVVGNLDNYTPGDAISDLRGTGAQVVEYERAGHGFVHDPDRPAHRAADAADAWSRAANWLWT